MGGDDYLIARRIQTKTAMVTITPSTVVPMLPIGPFAPLISVTTSETSTPALWACAWALTSSEAGAATRAVLMDLGAATRAALMILNLFMDCFHLFGSFPEGFESGRERPNLRPSKRRLPCRFGIPVLSSATGRGLQIHAAQ